MPRGTENFVPSFARSRLFHKYAALLFAVVALSVILTGILHTWFSYQELKVLLLRAQTEQARSAASKIGQFVKEIQGQLAWITQVPLSTKTDDEWRFDAVRLFRQAPPITEIEQIDSTGRERYRSSRQAMDVIGSMQDLSRDPAFTEAFVHKSYFGPVYFVRESEPYMTVAIAGSRPDQGVAVAQVNLKFIWDVVSQIQVQRGGQVYVVDSAGRLIAHPDISRVLRKTDLSRLSYVQAALGLGSEDSDGYSSVAAGIDGKEALLAYAPIDPLGWFVFAELPVREAFAPLYDRLIRSIVLLLAGLVLAVLAGLFFARRMVVPIRTLTEGARRIGGGDLTQRIAIATDDELEELGKQFNSMAAQLQDSYSTLEGKVEDRTRQLELATQAKSRFLATASHDLRQPLHALGLFVAQLRGNQRVEERNKIITRIESALSAMNELFNALLDVTKLDAGVLTPALTDFPVAELLKRVETTFGESARQKGLALAIVDSTAWIRSDFILLERIVANFVSNAVRYTKQGSVLVGCRREGSDLRIEVWDTGHGIPEDQRQNVFGEFYRLKSVDGTQSGFGLGLAIVDRLSQLLDHPIHVHSIVGKGSCFSVTVKAVDASAQVVKPAVRTAAVRMSLSEDKFIVVIDNDPMVLEAMSGLLRRWGCRIITAETADAAVQELADNTTLPDLIISDYHLSDGKTGIEAIAQLRAALGTAVPALLMSGDVNAGPLRAAQETGFPLLHKPVEPMTLRATLMQITKKTKQRAAAR
jgi:signal transduction histidine kinase/CheY-like chemotaxis protein